MPPPADNALRLTELAVELRRRTPWEAIDLGLSMMQRWRRAVYVPHLIVSGTFMACAILIGWLVGRPWVALLAIWYMKPLYDRVVLYVLSRAVFGSLPRPRQVLAAWREWLGSGLLAALFLRWWPDLARSFNLPVRQLEGQGGAAGRERRGILGRRARGHAVWLTFVCIFFEIVLYLMLGGLAELALPATATEHDSLAELFTSGDLFTYGGAAGYAVAVLLLEPFYVAAGFGLYLNRRTLLEGWDIEVALRRIAERHAATVFFLIGFVFCAASFSLPTYAQEKSPKQAVAEVLKDKDFGYERDATRWQARDPSKPREPGAAPDLSWLANLGQAIAKIVEILLWVLAAVAVAYALWFLARLLPRGGDEPPPEPYRPPPALFGMDLAPETLPADVGSAAADLVRAGKLREALSLLYRGSLSSLVHKHGVQLLASHTEAEVLSLSGQEIHSYLEKLIDAWRLCAYAKRSPDAAEVERLAHDYRASFA
ncbi:MAG TPA: hypothetical protein VGI18_15375 [Burkholderiales bacterium]